MQCRPTISAWDAAGGKERKQVNALTNLRGAAQHGPNTTVTRLQASGRLERRNSSRSKRRVPAAACAAAAAAEIGLPG